MSKTNANQCQNCQSLMRASPLMWFESCDECGLESSYLYLPEFNGSNPIGWTESAVEFLEQLRFDNAHIILKELSKHIDLKQKNLMDIGCAAGWFMSIAAEYGVNGIGIEPDTEIAKTGKQKGLDIKNVMFPDNSLTEENVDLVTFNDVFEHVEDISEVLQAVYSQLNDSGLLMINLPNSNGVFYRIARMMAKVGYVAPFERLWQKGYVSPHLHYFNHHNLQQVCQLHGFELLSKHSLPSIQIKGLWERIRHNGAQNIVTSAIMYAGMSVAYPLIRYVLPSDIIFHIYQKK